VIHFSVAILAIASPTNLDMSVFVPSFLILRSEADQRVTPVVSSIN
jgi:hypothetical protein